MTWLETVNLEQALAHGLKEQEFEKLVEMLGRPLNLLELGICSSLYSEHCSYKSTKIHLATLPSKGERVIHGPGENAGVLDIGDGQAVVFKVESHNHPSYIEPFQGAATGVGGILRDVFTMGARPLALMNSLRFGEASHQKTSHLISGAVSGIGTYGNCMGIPTVGGEVFFHKAYNGNCLVNAFALGVVDHESIFLGAAAGIGNSILYVGSKTGRDGIHGATMASDVFDESSEEKRPTVQVGDPFQEKLLLEACLEAMATGAVVGIQDMGAAGLTSSAFEMAERADTGITLHLDKVPQREEGMNPYEIMLSESQERMLLIVERGKEQIVRDVVSHWELDAVHIGEVTESKAVELFWFDDLVSSMPVSAVTSNVPKYDWPQKEPDYYLKNQELNIGEIAEPDDLDLTWLLLLSSKNLCSRSAIYDQYDSTVRSNTVVHPGGDAALIRLKKNDDYNLGSRAYKGSNKESKESPEKGIAMTLDCNSRYCFLDPKKGAALSVAESYRNITAVGAKAIGISDCLNFANPERPEGMWQIAKGISGLAEAANSLDIPIISGNVSLYNESPEGAILPTPLIAMVGLIEDASKAVGIHFKNNGDRVFVIGETRAKDLGGSSYLAECYGIEKGKLPDLDYKKEIKISECIRGLIDQRLLVSCHDVSDGGLAIALSESCFNGNSLSGVSVACESEWKDRKDALLFSESSGRYIISCLPENEAQVRKILTEVSIEIFMSGTVGGRDIEIKEIASIPVTKGYDVWSNSLSELF